VTVLLSVHGDPRDFFRLAYLPQRSRLSFSNDEVLPDNGLGFVNLLFGHGVVRTFLQIALTTGFEYAHPSRPWRDPYLVPRPSFSPFIPQIWVEAKIPP